MKPKVSWIVFYVIIVTLGCFIVYRRIRLLETPEGDNWLNYALIVGFILFTYINLRKLIDMIKKAD